MNSISITRENQLKLKQFSFIILYWLVMIKLIVMSEIPGIQLVPESVFHTKFMQIMRANELLGIAGAFSIGFFTGITELYLLPKLFLNKSFLKTLFLKLGLYFLSLIINFIAVGFVYYKADGNSVLHSIASIGNLFNSDSFLYMISVGFLLSLSINFIMTVRNKIGITSFIPIVLGRYYKPREEDLVFLFIDLKSSSQMAEQLGHQKYSEMLQDCYREFSRLVIKYEGSIYQFVGDEVVVTWKHSSTRNIRNSVLLFFSFLELLKEKEHYYKKSYSVRPEFKGAINAGKVITAEVGGFLKSEIAHHGDVLNTASRMLEKAKARPSSIVVSESVKSTLIPVPEGYSLSYLETTLLRGKKKPESLYRISDNRLNYNEEHTTKGEACNFMKDLKLTKS